MAKPEMVTEYLDMRKINGPLIERLNGIIDKLKVDRRSALIELREWREDLMTEVRYITYPRGARVGHICPVIRVRKRS